MDRLIGTNDAYTDNDQNTQSRLSAEAITSLMHVVLELLGPTDGDVNQVNAEVVFPALQLLQRIQPPEAMAEKVQHSVLRLGSNRQWHVRDKAAKTYATLVPVKDRVSRVTYLVLREARYQNESHGCLLGARYLIERLGKDTTTEGMFRLFQNTENLLTPLDIETLMTTIQSRMGDLLYDNACPFTQAAFVDVQVSFFYAAIKKQRYLFGTFGFGLSRSGLLTFRSSGYYMGYDRGHEYHIGSASRTLRSMCVPQAEFSTVPRSRVCRLQWTDERQLGSRWLGKS